MSPVTILHRFQVLSPMRQAVAVLSMAALLALFFGLVRLALAPNYALLYSGLDPAAAGQVVGELERQGIRHEIRASGIYVPREARDRLRLSLAAEGFPEAGGAGYELLDTLTGFGTTSQMFDAAYWRAKEGELARTIASSPSVKSARVHIATESDRWSSSQSAPTASVFLTPAGSGLGPGQSRALQFLVASAVARMAPDAVAIIDASTGALLSGQGHGHERESVDARADRLRSRLRTLLEAQVGRGQAVVEVFVDTAMDREAIFERRIDPDTRVAISTETRERSEDSANQSETAVGVASNLPEGDTDATGAESKSTASETTERVNYEVSERTREVEVLPGAIKRITVAVLVNDTVADRLDAAGEPVLRSTEELSALEDLVKSSIGFDAERGDTVTVRAMPLALAVEEPGPQPQSWRARAPLDLTAVSRFVALAIVSLVLGIFVVRPVLLKPVPLQIADGVDSAGEPDGGRIAAAEPSGLPAPPVASPLVEPEILPAVGRPSVQQADRFQRLIAERETEASEVLRQWIEGDRGMATK